MRALLERSRPARCAVAVLAIAAVLPLVEAASAQDVFGFRLESFLPDLRAALDPPPAAPAAPVPAHRARRIWAASRSRPLRIALARRRTPASAADRHGPTRVRAALVSHVPEPQVVFPKLIVLPKPPRPALVSIYDDRTLRAGDAVMMADGIRVFRGRAQPRHRPEDFVRLSFAAALDWRLRQTLDELDRTPPTRWSANGPTAG